MISILSRILAIDKGKLDATSITIIDVRASDFKLLEHAVLVPVRTKSAVEIVILYFGS